MSDVLALPFDQYQRYRLVSDLLGLLRGQGPALSVLDVGGRTALLREFLEGDRITLVDLEPSGESGLVLGDGSALPFADQAFDVVCAFDTLEHIPPPQREAFVGECHRVAKRWVVLAGPYQAPRVDEAELLLARFLKQKLGLRHRYLEEHRAAGLPVRAETERTLRSLGGRVTAIGHANLERWLALMCLSLYLDHDPALRQLATSVHRFYNKNLYASDHAEPVYRHLVIAALAGAPLPDARELLSPPVAPAGALEPFTQLTSELVAFDRERCAWKEERAKLHTAKKELERDLKGHRQTLRETDGELAASKSELATLTRKLEHERDQQKQVALGLTTDLDRHKQTLQSLRTQVGALEGDLDRERRQGSEALAKLERDLAAGRSAIENLKDQAAELRSEYERALGEHVRVLATLTGDLEQHKRSLATQTSELSGLRGHAEELESCLASERAGVRAVRESLAAERDQHAQVAAALGADLAGHRGKVADLGAELEATRAAAGEIETALHAANESARGLQSTLAQRESELALLRASVSSRVDNIKRALSPKKTH